MGISRANLYARLGGQVRTRAADLEGYLCEMAHLHRRVMDEEIDRDNYVQMCDALETKYADRLHESDRVPFDTETEYRRFFANMKRARPDAAPELDALLAHEIEHMKALRKANVDGVEGNYSFWFVMRENGDVTGCPMIDISGPVDERLEARRATVGAPSTLSPSDAIEAGVPLGNI